MNRLRNRRVSSSLSKIPYSGFSPVRLQTGIKPRPSSTMLSLSVRPAFTQTSWTYARLKSLSPKGALIRRGTFVQAELPLSYMNHPVQRSLTPQRVMLSRRIIAYYDLMRASLPLPPTYVFAAGSSLGREVPQFTLPVCFLRAVFRTPADRTIALGCSFIVRFGLPHLSSGSASTFPTRSGSSVAV